MPRSQYAGTESSTTTMHAKTRRVPTHGGNETTSAPSTAVDGSHPTKGESTAQGV